ncbi:MAG: hypothetical protein ABI968_03445 [Acidobacteriota bacterium]
MPDDCVGKPPRSGAAWAAAFFVAATVLMTWPQAAHLNDRLNDLWDAKQNAWILHWDFIQTFRDPGRLFQAPILHPARYALAFSESLYGAAVFGFPLLAAGAPILVNYNVVFLLGMAFSAWSAWLLARYVTGDGAASLLAGLVYAFVPWRFAQLPHINMQWGGFLCLLMLCLLRYLDAGRGRDLVLFALCFAGNLLATLHYGLFAVFLVGATLIFGAFGGGPERFRRFGMVLAAVGAAVLVCAPFLLPYAAAEKLYGMRRRIEEMETFSARLRDFLSAGSRNRLYGARTLRWSRAEGDLFPGLLPMGLAIAAILGLRRMRSEGASPAPPVSPVRRRAARGLDVLGALCAAAAVAGFRGMGGFGHPSRWCALATVLVLMRAATAPFGILRRLRLNRRAALFLCVGLVGVLVALGAHTPFYRFLFVDVGFVFRAIRVPARGIVLFHIALGVLAAWGLSLLTRRRGPIARGAGIGAALVLLALEYRAFPLELFPYDGGPRAAYEWLRSWDAPGPVIEWPLGFPYDCESMLRQAEHRRPLVNGHQSYFPPAYEELVRDMGRRPIAAVVWDEIARLDAEILIFHPDEGPFYERVRYRRLLREGLSAGRLRPIRAFREGEARTMVFGLSGTSAGPSETLRADADAHRAVEVLLAVSDADAAPPTGLLQAPSDGQVVAPGFWGLGWAVDDSGIAEVSVATERGPAGNAQLGSPWPGLTQFFPDLPGAERGGFGFPVPDLPAGPHDLKIILLGRDGGATELTRHIVVTASPAKR